MTAKAIRDGYGRALLRLAEDPSVVVLEADLGKSTRSSWFRAEHPERTFSMGVSEQNMVLAAAGMAASGLRPYASTFAIFSERAFEQVRNGVARPNLPVHLCGSHGGIHTGEDGSSAQAIEDLAIYRALPNMTVVHPADDVSAEELTMAMHEAGGPGYMRTCRNKVERIYEEGDPRLRLGEGVVLREGADVAILACGILVVEALAAAESLAAEGIDAAVADVHTLKPLDDALVARLAKRCGCLVTAEDHSVIGGLGGAVAEALSALHPAPLERVGVADRFGESGRPADLMERLGLTADAVAAAARRALARKGG